MFSSTINNKEPIKHILPQNAKNKAPDIEIQFTGLAQKMLEATNYEIKTNTML